MKKTDIQTARQIICGYGIGSEKNLSWWTEMEKVLTKHVELQIELDGDYHSRDTDKVPRKDVGLPSVCPARKFKDRQVVLIKEDCQGRGKVHPYGHLYWYVDSAECRNGERWDYYCKLLPGQDIPVRELARKAAWCMENELLSTEHLDTALPAQDVDKFIEETKLTSSNIDTMSYAPPQGLTDGKAILRVKFTSGDVYEFYDVPHDIAEGLRTAHSPGGFFATHIRGSFKYKKLD